MTSLISFLLIISFLIFIHELGHLLAAKWANVKVDDFSIGFGPKIFSFNIGETKYSLSLLPLGGYVKMQGEDISEISKSDEVIQVDPNRSFKNIENYKKQIILFAGPAMNLLLPFIFLPLIYINGIELPSFLSNNPIVGHANKSYASEYFRSGDEIISINGVEIKTWEDIKKSKPLNFEEKQEVLIKRNDKLINVVIYNNGPNKIYILDNIYPLQEPIIDQVLPNSLANQLSILKGDRIIKINNTQIDNWYQISEVLKDKGTKKYKITLNRNNEIIIKNVEFIKEERILGITPEVKLTYFNFGLGEAIKKGYDDSIMMTKMIFNGIIGLFSSLFSSDSSMSELKSSLAGPISIAKYSGIAAERGINSLIQFIVVISINLGIINLLPIPLLDGGHILFNTIESVTRRKINPKVQNFINRIGFAILITLMLFAIYNDIVNF